MLMMMMMMMMMTMNILAGFSTTSCLESSSARVSLAHPGGTATNDVAFRGGPMGDGFFVGGDRNSIKTQKMKET